MAEEVGQGATVPDWYEDPMGRHQHRYWDGTAWTQNVADAGQVSIDPLSGPGADDAVSEPEAAVAVPPSPEERAVVTPEVTAPAPKKKGRVGLFIGIALGLVALVAAVVGGVLYMNSVGSARTAAGTAITAAETLVADAALAAEDGNDAVSGVDQSKTRLAEAKAKMAAGTSFSAAPYREAKSLAAAASSSANEVLRQLDASLAEADSLGSSGSYSEAVQAWSELAETYPRSRQAADARQAAVDMLTGDVADDSGVTLEKNLQLCIDVAVMFPSNDMPDELSAHVNKTLLDAATSEFDTLQEISTANANWARELASKGRISGAVVDAFQNQEYDSSDVERIQRIQGMVGTLGQPEQMGRLYGGLTNATSLAAACRSVADHPQRETSTSRTFSSAQIKSVKDKAAAMQKSIDECRALANSLSTTI